MNGFIADDKWAVRVLKAKGEIYLTDWTEWCDYISPEIEVTKLLPEGGGIKVGVLGDDGIFDCLTHPTSDGNFFFEVVNVAGWEDIEVLPEWGAE